MYVGEVFCAFLISEVTQIIIQVNQGSRAMHDLMSQANNYMCDTCLPIDLRDKVRRYLRMEYNASNLMYDEDELLEMLPNFVPVLRLFTVSPDDISSCLKFEEISLALKIVEHRQ